jgi:glycosyltransferase involved in cell wall biosynthesis
MEDKLKISVVIPVYNSEKSIAELVDRIVKTLQNYIFEIILVNDGSKDKSWIEIEKQKNIYPDKIRAINLTKNFGQHNALLCGFSFCNNDLIITLDDDLQHPPEEINKLVATYINTDADVIYGMYKQKNHSFIRNTGSAILRKTSDYREINQSGGSSFRLIKKRLIDILISKHANHYLYIDEILNWYKSAVALVEVEHHPRKYGKSGYTISKLIIIYINNLYHYSTKPLKIIAGIGFFTSIISFLIGLRFIYKKIVHGIEVPGYTSIIVSIMFSTGLILLCLGIIGNYLYKLYHLQQKRPPYTIKNIL